MTPKVIQKIIGGSSILLGLLWLGALVFPFAREIRNADMGGTNIAFLLILVPVMGIPSVLSVLFGVRLLQKIEGSSLIRVIGLFAVFGALSLSAGFSAITPKISPESALYTAMFFVSCLIMIPIYIFVARALLRKVTGQTIPKAWLFSKGFLILMAWQFWLLLIGFFEEYSPRDENYTFFAKEPWDTIGFIISIIVPYVTYRICMAKLTKAQQHAVGNPFAAE